MEEFITILISIFRNDFSLNRNKFKNFYVIYNN